MGPEKFQKTIRRFRDWIKQRGLRPIEIAYTSRGRRGVEQLLVTEDGDPESEKFYRVHYARADLLEKKAARRAEKASRPPDLAVFEKVSAEGEWPVRRKRSTKRRRSPGLLDRKKQPSARHQPGPGEAQPSTGRQGGPRMLTVDPRRPVESIARDLGVTREQFREAFKKVRTAPCGERPT